MANALLIVVLLLLAINLVVTAMLLLRRRDTATLSLDPQFAALDKSCERTERGIREEMSRSRDEASSASRQLREELGKVLKSFGDQVSARMIEIANLQKGQLDTFSAQLGALTTTNERKLEALRESVEARLGQMQADAQNQHAASREESARSFGGLCESLLARMLEIATLQKNQLDAFVGALTNLTQSNDKRLEEMRSTIERKLSNLSADAAQNSAQSREEMAKSIKSFGDMFLSRMSDIAGLQKGQLETFAGNLATLTQTNEQKLDQMREMVEAKLGAIQQDNAAKLEQMRATVDEKLHATLEQRLGDSFKIVSDRLELVHKGLGEMQTLASGVGDLKKVLTNIKTRGCWGEVQLGNLLEQMLTVDQYESNVAMNVESNERVEYAIKLPGRDIDGRHVWLPIDAKFPQEDYQRLVDAQDRGDVPGVDSASIALEMCVRQEGKKIHEKYINPPSTTDFAIMFLPTEGLFAEVLRRPGLCDGLLRDHRVVVSGPTTLAAVLSSLQMGFRTLAVEKRSSEVWTVLGAVKSEFGKFGQILDKVQKKLGEASRTIDTAQVRSRAVERQLRGVQQPAADGAAKLLDHIDVIGIDDETLESADSLQNDDVTDQLS